MKALKTVLVLLTILSFNLSRPVCSYPAGQDDASTYYPLVAGNVWTYQFADNKSTVRYDVVGHLDDRDTYLVSCLTKMIDVNIKTEEIMGNSGGRIIHIGGTDIKFGKNRRIYDNVEVLLKTPLTAGATWEYDKDNRDNGLSCRVKCRVVKITDCEVKAGEFENVCVVQRTACYYKDNEEKYRKVQNEYYAPGVGEIKEESVDALGNANVLMELLEYKIK
jgi:hypothetical protein